MSSLARLAVAVAAATIHAGVAAQSRDATSRVAGPDATAERRRGPSAASAHRRLKKAKHNRGDHTNDTTWDIGPQPKPEELAAWCKAHKELMFTPHGGFCPGAKYNGMDPTLAPEAADFFASYATGRVAAAVATIGDFGAGGGWYSNAFNKTNSTTRLASFAYDYNPAGPAVTRVDLTKTLSEGVPVFDFVLCLEVGEHVPPEFEATLLDNLASHARHAIVLSWALPGTHGTGHVNTKPNEYVEARMTNRGWRREDHVTLMLRTSATFQHFKKTLMAFVREDDALKGTIKGGLVHTRHSGPVAKKSPTTFRTMLDKVEASGGGVAARR